MDREAIQKSLTELRERRAAIPALRDYRPQKGGKKSAKDADSPPQTLAGALGKLSGLNITVEE